MRIALCSGKGSPGISSLACVIGAVWPVDRDVVIAECDPSGNDLAVRFGLAPRQGMASLVLARRSDHDTGSRIGPHLQTLPGGLPVLTGPVILEAARAVDRELASLGSDIFPPDVDVLIDCGRLTPEAPGQRLMVNLADRVLVGARPDIAGIAHAQRAVETVRVAASAEPWFVTIGRDQFQDAEIERAIGVEVVERVARDDAAAAIVCGIPGDSRILARSRLIESARRLVARLLTEDREVSRETVSARNPSGDHGPTPDDRPFAVAAVDVPGSNGRVQSQDVQ